MTTPDDDLLVCMGLESCWITQDAALELIEQGLCEYSLFQDEESRAIEDGLVLTDGTNPEDVWRWIADNDLEATDETIG